MKLHSNAPLGPKRREQMARRVLAGEITRSQAARAYGVSAHTVAKWARRLEREGPGGMADRSSRPHRPRSQTPDDVVERIIELRRLRRTARHIAREVGVSVATVSRVLRRAGLSRMKDLDPPVPARRYEREHPGELVHLDIKELRRFRQPGYPFTGNRNQRTLGAGTECYHVAVDDTTRLAYIRRSRDQKAHSAVAHLRDVVAWFASLGVRVRSVMTDNGGCYVSKGFAKACRELGIKHIRTKPYTPRTNGKAERFIQTLLREWARAREYRTSDERAAALPAWVHMYNWHRPHGGLNGKTPISRLGLDVNNLLRFHTYIDGLMLDRPVYP